MTPARRAELKRAVDQRIRELVGPVKCECDHCESCYSRRKRDRQRERQAA